MPVKRLLIRDTNQFRNLQKKYSSLRSAIGSLSHYTLPSESSSCPSKRQKSKACRLCEGQTDSRAVQIHTFCMALEAEVGRI